MKVPISGGTPTALASGQPSPNNAIAVDATSVYWTNNASNGEPAVLRVPLGGGTPTTIASDQYPFAIAVSPTSVFWTNDGGTVMRFDMNACERGVCR
jgi:hypothetical protein